MALLTLEDVGFDDLETAVAFALQEFRRNALDMDTLQSLGRSFTDPTEFDAALDRLGIDANADAPLDPADDENH